MKWNNDKNKNMRQILLCCYCKLFADKSPYTDTFCIKPAFLICSKAQRPVGLVVWFSLRVREVPGSTPGLALLSDFNFVYTSFHGSPSFLTTAKNRLQNSEPICPSLLKNSFSSTYTITRNIKYYSQYFISLQ